MSKNETMDEKIKRLTREREENNKRINKMLAERDLTRNERYFDKKNELMRDLALAQHNLDRLEQQAAPIRKKIQELEEQVKKLDYEHENYLDHCFMYSDIDPRKAK